ncbi:hypothetical protein PInf_007379 [Phytophthora infestans]|nr:hypothetical protein PInf_007379 [Phytophthora infestans]
MFVGIGSSVLTVTGKSTSSPSSTQMTTARRNPRRSPQTKAREKYSIVSPAWSASGGSSDALRPGIVLWCALDAAGELLVRDPGASGAFWTTKRATQRSTSATIRGHISATNVNPDAYCVLIHLPVQGCAQPSTGQRNLPFPLVEDEEGDMRTRDGSPRRRGPGLSDITRAGETETPSAEEGSAAQRDEETVSGNDMGSEGKLDVEVDDDGVDVKNDDVDVCNEPLQYIILPTTKFDMSQDLDHAAILHLARIEWEALHRLAAVSGEAVVTSLLRSATPDELRVAAQEFMERELADANRRVSTPSRISTNDIVKLETSTYSRAEEERLPLNHRLRKIDIAIASRLTEAPSANVHFLLSRLSGKAKE